MHSTILIHFFRKFIILVQRASPTPFKIGDFWVFSVSFFFLGTGHEALVTAQKKIKRRASLHHYRVGVCRMTASALLAILQTTTTTTNQERKKEAK